VLDHLVALPGIQEGAEDHVEDFAGAVAHQHVLRAGQAVDLGDLAAHQQALVHVAVGHRGVLAERLLDFLGGRVGVLGGHQPLQGLVLPGQLDVRGDVHGHALQPRHVVVFNLLHSRLSFLS